jgi:hypothetical protein
MEFALAIGMEHSCAFRWLFFALQEGDTNAFQTPNILTLGPALAWNYLGVDS